MKDPDEGIIKFSCECSLRQPPTWDGAEAFEELAACRTRLKERGWLGEYQTGPLAGIGFGNVSVRSRGSGHFWITGSATGRVIDMGMEHVALVTAFDVASNSVQCEGWVPASSETMTHAVIYDSIPDAQAVVHIHEPDLWQMALDSNDLPRSDAAVPYGTPEMVRELERLLHSTSFGGEGVMAMAGHDEGLLAFGSSLEEAERRLLDLQHQISRITEM